MKYYYDFHIHTCLSPCGDDQSTPASVVGIAKINGLDVIAICDHNSCKNVRACQKCGEEFGILVLAGMEVTTSDEIHVLCLFEDVSQAEKFESFLEKEKIKIENDKEIFGNQLIVDEDDNVVGEEKYLLIWATNLGVYQIRKKVEEFGGVTVPAHIDKDAYSLLAVLGDVDKDLGFSTLEVSKNCSEHLKEKYKGLGYKIISNSDAHSLINIAEKQNFLELESLSTKIILKHLK